ERGRLYTCLQRGEDVGSVVAVGGGGPGRGHPGAPVPGVVRIADRAGRAGGGGQAVVDVVGEGPVAGLAVADLLEQVVVVVGVRDGGLCPAGGIHAVPGLLGPAQHVVLGHGRQPRPVGRPLQQTRCVVGE